MDLDQFDASHDNHGAWASLTLEDGSHVLGKMPPASAAHPDQYVETIVKAGGGVWLSPAFDLLTITRPMGDNQGNILGVQRVSVCLPLEHTTTRTSVYVKFTRILLFREMNEEDRARYCDFVKRGAEQLTTARTSSGDGRIALPTPMDIAAVRGR